MWTVGGNKARSNGYGQWEVGGREKKTWDEADQGCEVVWDCVVMKVPKYSYLLNRYVPYLIYLLTWPGVQYSTAVYYYVGQVVITY